MEDLKQQRDDLIRRFKASRDRKRAHLIELEKSMRAEYKEKMGVEAKYFNVW